MTLPQELKTRVSEAVEQFYDQSSLSPQQATFHWNLAMEIRSQLEATPEPISTIEDEIHMDVAGWLLDLPFTLAHHGLVDEAVTLGAQYAELAEAENFLGDRAVILAEAGRHEDARAQTVENLTRFSDDPWVIIKSGDVYEQLGDLEEAERLYRQGMDLAGNDTYTREGAMERLIPLLNRMGRETEAETLIEVETTRAIEWKEHVAKAWPGVPRYPPPEVPSNSLRDLIEDTSDLDSLALPYVREIPKVGRNDPCPCGSGKKYKKCCLGRS